MKAMTNVKSDDDSVFSFIELQSMPLWLSGKIQIFAIKILTWMNDTHSSKGFNVNRFGLNSQVIV